MIFWRRRRRRYANRAAAINNFVGTRFKIIPGYQNILQAAQPAWLPEKKVNVLFHTGRKQPPELPSVPMIRELAKSKVDAQALEFILARELISRLFVGPPGVPPERTLALQAAFLATMQDPQFILEAKKMQLDIDPLSGDEVVDILRKAAASPPDVLERVVRST